MPKGWLSRAPAQGGYPIGPFGMNDSLARHGDQKPPDRSPPHPVMLRSQGSDTPDVRKSGYALNHGGSRLIANLR